MSAKIVAHRRSASLGLSLCLLIALISTAKTLAQSVPKKAPAVGLDPNKWFGNVELLVGQSVGPVTVQYVSNIYKYYVAYKLVIEQGQSL